MDSSDLFLAADAALRSVVDRIDLADLDQPVPKHWTQRTDEPVLRDILAAHAYDEAWIPDVLAGKSTKDGDPWADRDLLGDGPIASYDRLNDTATSAVRAGVEPGTVLHFQYGDYSAEEGFSHLAMYRAFQAWGIAHRFGIGFHLSDELIAGLNEHVLPHADEWRQWGVFPPEQSAPEGADAETVLLCAVGLWEA